MSKKFAIIKGNIVDCVVIADAPLERVEGEVWIDLTNVAPEPCREWFYENGAFSPPPPPPPYNVLSKVEFRFRFADAEYAAILGAAKTDVEVQTWVETFNMVTMIDLDNQRTKDGISVLVNKNLLTQQRANEILATSK